MAGDLVPRNVSGVATADGGDVGTTALPFKRAAITAGYFFAGQIISMHTYNGLLSPGHGWMKMDGRIINEANYNTEHGAGSWATYVISSALNGKYLPDTTSRLFLSGRSTTTEDGSVAIATEGNSFNQIDLQHSHTISNHTHTIPDHNHQWYDNTGTGATPDNTYNSGGGSTNITLNSKTGGNHVVMSNSAGNAPADSYTDTHVFGTTGAGGTSPTANALTTNQDIQPYSIAVIYYMRII
jgi:hypothetical protein